MAYDNSQVAHVWANGRKAEGRSHNGNLNFDGATIRSYRTPIACYLDDAEGRKTFLVTSETFSPTTSSKHMPAVNRAVSGPTFRVPFVNLAGLADWARAQGHAANLAHLRQAADTVAQDAAKKKPGTWATEWTGVDNRPRFVNDAYAAVAKAEDYAKAFGLDYDAAADRGRVAQALDVFRERERAFNDPAAVAKREKANAKAQAAREAKAEREAQEAAERAAAHHAAYVESLRLFIADNSLPLPRGWDRQTWNADTQRMESLAGDLWPAVESAVRDHVAGALDAWIAGPEDAAELGWSITQAAARFPELRNKLDTYHAIEGERNRARMAEREAREAAREAREAARQAERAQREADNVADFYAGRSFRPFHLEDGTAALRREGDELVTSQQARVPWAEAVRVFRFAKLCRERRQAWAKNGVRAPVGHFEVDRIDADGGFRAGCHRIGWAAQERLAQAEGLADIAPDTAALVETAR